MCETDMNKERITFLYNSIGDIQGTIRAVDNKLNFIMVILVIPLTKLNAIYSHINLLITNHEGFLAYALPGLFVIIWGLALIVTLRGLSSIENPSKDIDPIGNGTYYGQYFKFSVIDAIIAPDKNPSNKTIKEIVKYLPKDKDELEQELAFEQIKLSYIRGLKISRQRLAYLFLYFWMVAGGLIWILSVRD